MKTQDLFKANKTSQKLNENFEKTFGKKLNLKSFDLVQLEDARNKLRTQISQVKLNSAFNENLENDTYYQAQWMLDMINTEISEREENSTQIPIEEDAELIEYVKNFLNEESQGDQMKKLNEGEVQQASAIVTAKTMVDRVGRWIEELSGMENETLLQLGDSIRDEMSQEQARAFIESVAPAIQQALDTLKGTRDTLSASVRSLASGEAPAGMIGAEPMAAPEGEMGPAEPDMMNAPAGEEPMPPMGDEFAAAEPAAGGAEAAGREKRESIDFGNRLLKTLVG